MDVGDLRTLEQVRRRLSYGGRRDDPPAAVDDAVVLAILPDHHLLAFQIHGGIAPAVRDLPLGRLAVGVVRAGAEGAGDFFGHGFEAQLNHLICPVAG